VSEHPGTQPLHLVVVQGAVAGRRLDVADELVLGRETEGPGELADDDRISRRHARILRTDDGSLAVEDLGSTNGTAVNDVRIASPTAVHAGDTIQVGDTILRVEETPAPLGLTPLQQRPSEQIGSPSSIVPLAEILAASPSRGTLVVQGRQLPIDAAGLSIGREEDNDVVVGTDLASRHHARVERTDGRYSLVDLGSLNGTYLNGERLVGESRWLNPGDTILVGDEPLRFVSADETGPMAALDTGPRRIRFDGARLTLGRDPTNDLQLDAPSVSRFHAEVVATPAGLELRDLGSRNGVRLDSRPVTQAPLAVGSEIGVGPFRLVFDGTHFTERDDRGALRLEAYDVTVAVKERVILDRGSLAIQPGEFVALIGESGAGKSTLIKVLAGVRVATSGAVCVSGEPVWTRLADVGYLPQDEIVHPRLTVAESLRFSARLRLPLDSTEEDVERAVQRVLLETELGEHAHTRIGALSGGQRKRVGLATELLNGPGLIFLDEPTTGLDPGLERRMMELFRGLAAVGRSAILVATHATRSLELVDKLVVVGRGGHICFAGPPREAIAFFGVPSYDDIYGALDRRPAVEWRADFEATPAGAASRIGDPQPGAPRPARVAIGKEKARRQAPILLRRYGLVFVRDPRNLLILLAQAPLLGLVMALLFKPQVFDPAATMANGAAQLLFVLVTTVIWLGTIASAREIIKERAIFERERAVGVDPLGYLASKAALLSVVVCVQTLLLFLVVTSVRPLHESSGTAFALLVELAVTGLVAVAGGLLMSALVRTEDQATAVIPIAMIAQLLFGGAIVTVKNMGAVMAAAAALVFERWSFAGAGRVMHMNGRLAADPPIQEQYGLGFFSLPVLAALVVLLLFLAAFGAATLLQLRRAPRQ
jgi:ABC-type multidrug transport system ATPase subunit/pSer/pThr/pTyr-binding forkhead associated (FHA) protein